MKRENIVMFIWECLISVLLVSLNGEMSEERWVRIGF